MTKTTNLFTSNYRFKTAIFLLVTTIITLLISLILLLVANFSTKSINYGNGFWALKNYSINTLLKSWYYLDYEMIKGSNNRPDAIDKVCIAIILLTIAVPILSITIIYLLLRAWIKTRI